MQSDIALKECSVNQVLRDEKCCIPVDCSDEGFESCPDDNSSDTCTPCPAGEYVSGNYSTQHFQISPCVVKPKCLPEQIRNKHGTCVCDRARGYYPQSPTICRLGSETCEQIGEEVDELGKCSSCKPGYFKDVKGPSICRAKTNITCLSGKILFEGGTSEDRTCVVDHARTTEHTTMPTMSPTTIVPTMSSTTIVPNQGVGTVVIVGILCSSILLLVIVLVVIFVRKRCVSKKQTNNREGHEHTEMTSLRSVEVRMHDEQSVDDIEQGEDGFIVSQLTNDDGTIEATSLHYVSGFRSTEVNPKATPFDDEDLPFADAEIITLNETTDNPFQLEGAVGGTVETVTSQDETNLKTPHNDEERNGRPLVRVAAQVHERQIERRLQLLTTQPINNDQGHVVYGPNSFIYQNGDPNRPEVIQNGRIDSIDVSIPSRSFEQIRPDINADQNTI